MDQSNDNKDMSLEELLDEVTGEEQPPAKESPAPRGRTKIRSVETSEEPMPGREMSLPARRRRSRTTSRRSFRIICRRSAA
ncbi:MAG: hypothetical protein IJV58_00205 [Oscillospiraceae bacterium]|nr:hypothetical protein [Oscillospiraceae bacterium]